LVNNEFEKCPIQMIRISDLPAPRAIEMAGMADYIQRHPRRDYRPLFVELRDGQYIIHDGNYRLARAIQVGRKEIACHVKETQSTEPNQGSQAAS
jgi:hypothetical protein